jgi:predicted nucleotidyltransferase
MKVLGIIAEYNPFHQGHLYHLNESKRITGATHTIAVMSGNFVQRGEPAIADKWTRAAMAIENGVDLVLEIPFVFASSSAEYFGEAGISLLDSLGVVDYVSYGSETDCDIQIEKVADFLAEESDEFKYLLKKSLSEGKSFPLAREEAITLLRPELKGVLHHSNNILAIEYRKAAKRIGSQIDFVSVKRAGSSYNEPHLNEVSFSSATSIRKKIHEEGTGNIIGQLPTKSLELLNDFKSINKSYPRKEDLFTYLQYKIKMSENKELLEVEGMREGLENVLKAAIYSSHDYDSFIEKAASKRYPRSSMQRLFLHLLLDLKKVELIEFRNCSNYYGRVLGFNENGRELLKTIKNISETKIITNINRQFPKDELLTRMLSYDIKATDFYMLLLCLNGLVSSESQDRIRMPYIG